MRLIEELQRRKVFKVGGAWLVGGWLLIQIAATIAPEFKLPDWVPMLVTVLVAIGFPIALVLAWFFDITPQGIRRDPADAHATSPNRSNDDTRTDDAASARAPTSATQPPVGATPVTAIPATATAPPRKSIAVLPFADLSPTRDQEYFSDGIAEEILNALVKLKDLKVAGRTSAFSFKGKNEDLRDIGRTLSVAHVLEGSVRKHGDKVRITAQLIHVEDGYHLWSESYDGELADVFDLQERIARAIVRELDVILHGDTQQRLVPVATCDPEAYALYLQAAGIFNRREGPRFPEAIGFLEKALALDPQFARAHARLASIHALEPIYVPERADSASASVQGDAARAIALDPRLAEPHAAIALNAVQEHRFLEGREASERALALDPDDITAVFWSGSTFINTGYIARGCALLDHALALDPLYPNALLWRGTQHFYAGDVDRAETLLLRAAQTGLLHADLGLHLVSAARGRRDEATAQLATGLHVLGPGLPDGLALTLARAVYGDAVARELAFEAIERIAATRVRLPGSVVYALLQMGEAARMLSLMRRSKYWSTNDAQSFHCLWQPGLRAMRAMPEFHAFARELGMTAVWDRYGAPDHARRDASGNYVFDVQA
ncbi:MAG: hypothetical protein JSR34_10055 [Proteobacteria bacterium]|nr:hypothetical protein [Pseudomonadota bacterium]